MAQQRRLAEKAPSLDPLWYKDAIIYELHVRCFHDSNGDGIGDFQGLRAKLDYLQDLGVTALWLLPFYPSPLRDDGYDIADYADVHGSYGNLKDFRDFLRDAHARGLRVITELVINHTSSEHRWFQRARRAKPGSPLRDFYMWSDKPDKYRDARIIFQDFEASNWAWDPVAGAYYWHRFYSHQPDLNYDNPRVHKAVLKTVDFWMQMGVDGMRLDAVPYLYARDGTNCENLKETHGFLRKLRKHLDDNFADRMLLAEANQWPEDAVEYFGQGDECHMNFHFPIMPRMFMALQLEDRFPISDILEQTPAIDASCQWALFLRNHDELTLEMVTDEDRDYMYKMYATDPRARINLGIRRRLAPLLEHRRKVELLNGLLFSLPGTPVIYYGDEIGMGDNIYLGDRDGVRTPMQWSGDRNAGFSRANPQQLYLPVIIDPEYHFEATNVEAQQRNPDSMLWGMKRLIALRKQHRAFGRGSIEFLHPDNRKVLAFVRHLDGENILVVANLSRFVQYVELDLRQFGGLVPTELFGQTPFPPIGEWPYLLTLGPHNFYWFSLQASVSADVGAASREDGLPLLKARGSWQSVFAGRARSALEHLLAKYLVARRWYGGKARRARTAHLAEWIPIPVGAATAALVTVRLDYREGLPEQYLLPLAFAGADRADALRREAPWSVVALLQLEQEGKLLDGVIYDAVADSEFCASLLEAMRRRRRFRGQHGVLLAKGTRALPRSEKPGAEDLLPALSRAEQSNSSVLFGERYILKLFRRQEQGPNPDVEMVRFLSERGRFAHGPKLAGTLEYQPKRGEPTSLAVLQSFVPNEGDAWQYTVDTLGRYFEWALTQLEHEPGALPGEAEQENASGEAPFSVQEGIGSYLASAVLLGERTAEMHLALASSAEDQVFAPEPFTALYQRSLYQTMRTRAHRAVDLLRKRLRTLPEDLREEARALLGSSDKLDARLKRVVGKKIGAQRIRCHGDYHLGQVLHTGNDFVVIDFEGEPARSISERRLKRSPLRDVAGMVRSFHYAAEFAARNFGVRSEDVQPLYPWAEFWHRWVSATYLDAYLRAASKGSFLPNDWGAVQVLLDLYLLEKAAYELEYELNHRPEWVGIPLRGLLRLVRGD